jgi:hypothetical protein
MSVRRGTVALGVAVVAVAASACGGSGSGPISMSDATVNGTSGVRALVVARAERTPVSVTGGTASMRARARRILEGMGSVAVASVRFGRAPSSYHQFRGVRGADWVFVTVRAPAPSRTTTPGEQDRQSWLMWEADVFERAYLSSVPGPLRPRGTSENVLSHGGVEPLSSGTTGGGWVFTQQLPSGRVVSRIRHAATAAGFGVGSITITRPDRLAVTARFTVSTRHGFVRRFNAFFPALARLGGGLDGLAWQLRDRCGNMVAQSASGWFVNPRWECPEPGTLGLPTSPAECRKLASHYRAC